jgi:hypothetical protein
MRIALILAMATLMGLVSSSSGTDWTIGLDASLMLTQNAYSENWAGGEAGSGSWAFSSNLDAEKQLNTRLHHKNTLRLSFGQTYNQDPETNSWSEPVKSTDLIDLESVLRVALGGLVDPFVAGRAETQWLDNSDPARDRYVNPIKFTESIGVARTFVKRETTEWSGRLGVGLRQQVNRDVLVGDPEPGLPTDLVVVRRETQTSNDGGIEFVSDFKAAFAEERITFVGKVTIFQPLYYSEAEELEGMPNEDYWKSPDVNWENTFTASIAKYLMVNLYLQLLYDKEVDLGARFKQTLSLGVTYKVT